MELQTVSQVSKAYGISTRMLRYYEQIGLIRSRRKENYAYRVYDKQNLQRLQLIIILRKMQIPVKQISTILNHADTAAAVEIFKSNIAALEKEMTALSTIKDILNRFVAELEQKADVHLNLDLLGDDSIIELADSLSLIQRNVKGKVAMKDLTRADKQLTKLKDVRLIYLPPMTVASYHFIGRDAAVKVRKVMDEFVKASGLIEKKPDLRQIGFDNPTNQYGDAAGYEMWVSIPEEMEVPEPLVKKNFQGGFYAAHAAENVNIDHWLALQEWVNDNSRYQGDAYSIRFAPQAEALDGYMEEHINYYNYIQNPGYDGNIQLDLLLPVKPIEAAQEPFSEVERSREKYGYQASYGKMNKFRVMGFSFYVPLDIQGDDKINALTKEFRETIVSDGRLEVLQKNKKPGAPILCFSSYDDESGKNNSWRYTVCIRDDDLIDEAAFSVYEPFVKKIDASEWVRFETRKGDVVDPHDAAPKLGYHFNGPISGYFDVYPDGEIGEESVSVMYCLFPVK